MSSGSESEFSESSEEEGRKRKEKRRRKQELLALKERLLQSKKYKMSVNEKVEYLKRIKDK